MTEKEIKMEHLEEVIKRLQADPQLPAEKKADLVGAVKWAMFQAERNDED